MIAPRRIRGAAGDVVPWGRNPDHFRGELLAGGVDLFWCRLGRVGYRCLWKTKGRLLTRAT